MQNAKTKKMKPKTPKPKASPQAQPSKNSTPTGSSSKRRRPRGAPAPKPKLNQQAVNSFAADSAGLIAPHTPGVVAIPAAVCRVASRLVQVMYDCPFEVDVVDQLTKFLALPTNLVPTVGHNQSSRPFWQFDNGLPVVRFNDVVCPMAIPVATPGVAPKFKFSYRVQEPTLLENASSNTANSYSPVLFTSPPTSTDGAIPSALRRKPVCAPNATTDISELQYVWIDANADANYRTELVFTTTVTIGAAFAFAPTTALALQVARLDDDGLGISTDYTTMSATMVQVSPNVWTATVTIITNLIISGFYSFQMGATVIGASTSPPSTFLATGLADINYRIHSLTGFLTDSLLTELASLASHHWVHGTSLLVSNRSPLLTTAGTILAANVRRVYPTWHAAVADSASTVLSKVDPRDTYRSGEGGKIQDGLFSWAKPSILPTSLYTTPADDGDQIGGTRMSLARIVNGPATVDAESIIYLNPSASAAGSKVEMRFTASRKISYVPRSRLIQSSAQVPPMLSDELDVLMISISRLNNFDTNDWHDSVRRWCLQIGRTAAAVYKVARFGAHVVEAAAPLIAAL